MTNDEQKTDLRWVDLLGAAPNFQGFTSRDATQTCVCGAPLDGAECRLRGHVRGPRAVATIPDRAEAWVAGFRAHRDGDLLCPHGYGKGDHHWESGDCLVEIYAFGEAANDGV